jgi:glycosyltransferase involved in cell wall biosynthesis
MPRVVLTFDWFLEYAAEQALGLSHAGADVLVVCRDHLQEFDGDHGSWLHHIAKMRDSGIGVCVIEGRTVSVRAMRTAVGAHRMIRAWRPDLVHAHPNPDPWLLWATRGVPLVLTVHDPRPHPGQPVLGRVKRRFNAAWLHRASGLVVHSEQLRGLLPTSARATPIAVIPHGVRPSLAPALVPRSPDILLLGRLEPYKGIDTLLSAMDDVWQVRPDVTLTIAGRGPCAADVPSRPRLRRILRYISADEVEALLLEATLFVAPYTEASQSGAVSQAVARGVPAVVSDAGALSDLTVNPSFVVPAGNAVALAEALLANLDHTSTLRQQVHAMASDRLSWNVTGSLALEFYDRVLVR